jgi:hypothetical protein
LCLVLVICELGLRIFLGVPLLDLPNFSDRDPLRVKDTVRYDADLGWALKENFDRADLHTLAYGNSTQRSGAKRAAPGHSLTVGASNTEVFALSDEQSWPAKPEALTGEPVDNAGVIGYGLDQMVLRAQQLLPIEQPRVLLSASARPTSNGCSRPSTAVPRSRFLASRRHLDAAERSGAAARLEPAGAGQERNGLFRAGRFRHEPAQPGLLVPADHPRQSGQR